MTYQNDKENPRSQVICRPDKSDGQIFIKSQNSKLMKSNSILVRNLMKSMLAEIDMRETNYYSCDIRRSTEEVES